MTGYWSEWYAHNNPKGSTGKRKRWNRAMLEGRYPPLLADALDARMLALLDAVQRGVGTAVVEIKVYRNGRRKPVLEARAMVTVDPWHGTSARWIWSKRREAKDVAQVIPPEAYAPKHGYTAGRNAEPVTYATEKPCTVCYPWSCSCEGKGCP